jgi:pimeloyl-ACP methyl ester carboxylesterase
MTTQQLTIKGIRISYIEQNPEARKTIFFIHGNSSSSATWKKQFNSELLTAYRLVAIDLPAHGSSEASPLPERDYTLSGLASILTEVIQELEKGPYILCGSSLATNILAEMIPFGIEPAGMFFAGPSLMGSGLGIDKIAIPGTDISALFKDEVPLEAIINYGKLTSQSTDPEDLEIFKTDFNNVQSPFRSLFLNSIFSGNLGDEIKQVNSISCPLAWVFGADEKVLDQNYLDGVDVPKWKDQVFKIPGASHLVNVDKPETFNTLLAEFAKDCFI